MAGYHLVEQGQRLGVQPALRLVEQQDGGVVEQRAGDAEALPQPVGHGPDSLVEPRLDSHPAGGVADALSGAVHAEHADGEGEILTAGELLVKHGLVGHNSDGTADGPSGPGGVESDDSHDAGVGFDQGAEGVDQGGLAGAVRA